MRFSDLVSPGALAAAFAEVRARSAAPGADGVTPESFARNLEERLRSLAAALGAETWQPSGLRRMRRDKPSGGVRVLAIPTVEDRIVIEVLRRAIEPRVEPLLSDAAYAYRPGRSAHEAVEAVARQVESGGRWMAQADVRDFFDTIRIDDVVAAVGDLVNDRALTRLLDRLLQRHARTPGRGLAQGSALSPLLSNVALLPLDRRLGAAAFPLVRYSDNLCVVAGSREAAEEALRAIEREVRRLGLSLKPAASKVNDVREGVLWLGFWIGSGGRRVGEGAIRALQKRVEDAARGLSGEVVRARVAPIVRGWAEYFDAPLPEGVGFGVHDAVVRELLAERAVTRGQPRAGAEGSRATAAGEIGLDVIGDWNDPDDVAPDEEGWEEEACGGEVERLLAEAERLASIGCYSGAEDAYDQAQRVSAASRLQGTTEPPSVDASPDEEAMDAFLGLFAACQDRFEAASRSVSGARQLAVVERPPSPWDVRNHLAGSPAMAVRPRLADGTCTLAVIDIDAPDAAGLVAARAHAQALVAVAQAWQWEVLIEETGGRGLHVWIPLSGRPRANDVALAVEALCAEAGHPKEGARVEAFPARDEAPDLHGQAITLPLGIHRTTEGRSRLRWVGGVEVGPDLRGLFGGRANDPDVLLRRVAAAPAAQSCFLATPLPEAASWGRFGVAVEKVMSGCAVLRHLSDKAASVGHLAHGERLSLLYSLGHLGSSGQQAIHAVIGRCANYDAAETARQIGRLSGLPIGCARMREKHVTAELAPLCACDFGDVAARGGYATPLLHAAGFRREWRAALRSGREVAARAPGTIGVHAVADEPAPREKGAARRAGAARGVRPPPRPRPWKLQRAPTPPANRARPKGMQPRRRAWMRGSS